MPNTFLTHWYFHLPNLILAIAMWTMLGRALLGLFFDNESKNFIWRGFAAITDPFLNVIAVVTPKAAAPVVLWLFGFVWMFWLRLALFVFFSLFGLAPTGAGG
jgi:hypothetical protein